MPPKDKDRAEQIRQRLAAKSASRSSPTGPLLAFLPGPSAKLLGGKTAAWICWALMAVLATVSILTGRGLPFCVGSALHAAYFANFSATDVAFQLRAVYAVLSGLAAMVAALRLAISIPLLAGIVIDLAVGYSLPERILYCITANRPDNPEPITLDFLTRVLMEPPHTSPQAFSLKPGKGSSGAAGEFEYGKTRAERRKR
mmetsp:Transcript_51927/g.150877  ORF Transcript_51927/g.150877 Transcript_51927/m.150877 type:complete len:200 (+) Transcript_51927:81-680(+)